MATETQPLGQDAAWLGKYDDVHMHVFGTPLRVLHESRDGMWLFCVCSFAAVGYAHPDWCETVAQQAQRAAHVSNYFATKPQIELATKLIELAGAPQGSHVYFGNSGAEANEAALKMAKLYGATLQTDDARPYRILALTHGFHGRTMGALSATWKPAIRTPFEPLVPNIEFVEANDLGAMGAAFATDDGKGPVAAVIMELIQGEAGVLPLDAEYIRGVRALCDEHNALMIVDEVQTGMGRTGAWFAFQRDDLGGITPDIVTFAKGVAGGFPMGGMISFGEELSALFSPGTHGSTFAGNPLGAAAALATISVIEREGLVAQANERGEQLRTGIMATDNPLFASVRGRGLLNAIVLTRPCAHAAVGWALDHGLIINAPSPTVLRLAPPLIASEQDINEAIGILALMPNDLATE